MESNSPPSNWSELTPTEQSEWLQDNPAPVKIELKPKKSKTEEEPLGSSLFVAIAVVVTFVLLLGAWMYLPQIDDWFTVSFEEEQQLVLEHDYKLAQEAVKAQLISPATAVFCPIGEVRIESHVKDSVDLFLGYRWTGWVDSQNRNGALVRSRWTAFSNMNSSYDSEEEKIRSYADFTVESVESR